MDNRLRVRAGLLSIDYPKAFVTFVIAIANGVARAMSAFRP